MTMSMDNRERPMDTRERPRGNKNIKRSRNLKKKLGILIALVMAISLCLVPGAASASVVYDSSLTLENKNYTTWAIKSDVISGTLLFNKAGPTFDFKLTGAGLTDGGYSLIYYADKEDRFAYWGGDNPGAVIATFTASGGAISSGDMSVDLSMNLPCPPDANMYDHDYTLPPDEYDNAHGAKIWLVPTGVLTGGVLPVNVWPPTDNWLFETELIWYDDTDVTNTGVGLQNVSEQITAITVSPTYINFGTVNPGNSSAIETISVENIGTVTVSVGAELDPLTGTIFNHLQLNGYFSPSKLGDWPTVSGFGSLSPSIINNVNAQLVIPATYSAQGTETATLIFIATP